MKAWLAHCVSGEVGEDFFYNDGAFNLIGEHRNTFNAGGIQTISASSDRSCTWNIITKNGACIHALFESAVLS